MADIDDVLERLVIDSAFRDQLASDPAVALAAYDLSADDLHLLASSLDAGDSAQRGVEQRTSKSAVIGLLASLTGGGGGGSGGGRGMEERLGGASGSKDSAGMGQLAPAEGSADELQRSTGKHKPGEITMTRTMRNEPEMAPPDSAARPLLDKHSGAADSYAGKGGSIVVMDPTNAAPGGDADDPFNKKIGPVKGETGETSIGGDGNLAPGETSARKVEIGAMKAGDTSMETVTLGGGDDPLESIEISNLKAGDVSATGQLSLPAPSADAPPDDFLTIEEA